MTTHVPRLFDCFTFFNELDVLALRLEELAPHVTRFVLVEATHSFTGQPKALHFQDNKARFASYLDRIEHVVVDDLPGKDASAWDREWAQRRAIRRGLEAAGANPDDFALISDVDEIPRPDVLAEAARDPASIGALTFFESELYLYFLNMRLSEGWRSPVQAPRLLQVKHTRDPQAIRATQPRRSKRESIAALDRLRVRAGLWRKTGAPLRPRVLPNAAWHFSFLGGAEKVREKLMAYSHTEYATEDRLDLGWIKRTIAEGRFIFDDKITLVRVPVDDSYPATILNAPQRWQHLIA